MVSRRASIALAVALLATACGPTEEAPGQRYQTDNFAFRVSSEPSPPRAREEAVYRVLVRDPETGEPIEGGEGRIFATSIDGANVWDPLLPGPELGTYYGTLRYVHSGDWAVAVEFRRDSTQPLERIDWMQQVFPPSESPVTP